MNKEVFEQSVTVPVSVERLWAWHLRPGAFERLAPPWQRLTVAESPPEITDGGKVAFEIGAGPFRVNWLARLGPVEPPHRFVDTQVSGPFGAWRHEHLMESIGPGESKLTDRVTYALPAWASRIPGAGKRAGHEIERLFRFRHTQMARDLVRSPEFNPGKGRAVLVSGSTGLIGRRLVPLLQTLGYEVRGLSRSRTGPGLFNWDPDSGEIDPDALQDVHGVVHLAGENIASGRWTTSRRARILNSRISGTRTLVDAMKALSSPPAVFVSASGANYYEMGNAVQDESGRNGDGFLAEVCRLWEKEAFRARDAGIRTVCLRTGVVLDPLGGALGKMLPAFRVGLGGPIGGGKQGFPWIAVDDLADLYVASLEQEAYDGPVNAVHPDRVDQRTFSHTLGTVLGRPAVVPVPAFAVRGLLGQMGRETLLANLFLEPSRARAEKFPFRHESLHAALAFLLGRPNS